MFFLCCDYWNNTMSKVYILVAEIEVCKCLCFQFLLVKCVVGFGLSWGCWESDGFSPLVMGFLGCQYWEVYILSPFVQFPPFEVEIRLPLKAEVVQIHDTWTSDFIWGYLKGFYYFLLTFLSRNIILNHTMKWNHSSYCLDSPCVVESLMLYVQDLSRPSWDFSCILFHMFAKKLSSSASNLAESWNAGNIFLFLMKYNCKYFVSESIKLELFIYVKWRGFPSSSCFYLFIGYGPYLFGVAWAWRAVRSQCWSH